MANDSKSDAKFEKKWTAEEHLKLVLTIWQHENSDLSVQGWKNLGDRIQKVFGGKCNLNSAQMQWKKIRNAFTKEYPADKVEEADAASASAKGKKSATPKTPASASRKRPAPASGDEDGDPAKAASADLDASATKPRKKRAPRKAETKTSPGSSLSAAGGSSSNEQAMGFEDEPEQQMGSSGMPESNRAHSAKNAQDKAAMHHEMGYDPSGETNLEMEPHET